MVIFLAFLMEGGTFFVFCDEAPQKITKKKHRVFLSLLRTQVVATKETKNGSRNTTQTDDVDKDPTFASVLFDSSSRVFVCLCVCVCVCCFKLFLFFCSLFFPRRLTRRTTNIVEGRKRKKKEIAARTRTTRRRRRRRRRWRTSRRFWSTPKIRIKAFDLKPSSSWSKPKRRTFPCISPL